MGSARDYSYVSGNVTVRPSTLLDIYAMKDRLSSECKAEVSASHGHSAEESLLWCYTSSAVKLTLEVGGEAVAMFGLQESRDSSRIGCAWVLTAPEAAKIPVTLVKLSKRYLQMFLEERPVLFNWIDARFIRSIAWVKALGGDVTSPQPYGPAQTPFCHVLFLKGGT